MDDILWGSVYLEKEVNAWLMELAEKAAHLLDRPGATNRDVDCLQEDETTRGSANHAGTPRDVGVPAVARTPK